MENKDYYLPEIEDFNVGFRYEYYTERPLSTLKGGFAWLDEEFLAACGKDGGSEIDDIGNLLGIGAIRVKYLDREDIEELNWKKIDREEPMITTGGIPEEYEILSRRRKKFKMIKGGSLQGPHNVKIYEGKVLVFRGRPRNYNELMTLMRQLSIR